MISRRKLVAGLSATAGLALLGYAGAGSGAPAAKGAVVKLKMHRSSGCGCCLKWAERAREAGFEVETINVDDMMALKTKLGVPGKVASCHTTLVAGYIVEGHVPLDAVKRLLAQRPKIKGIAVPGMPLGAPGMEVHGEGSQPFDVLAFDAEGNVRKFG